MATDAELDHENRTTTAQAPPADAHSSFAVVSRLIPRQRLR